MKDINSNKFDDNTVLIVVSHKTALKCMMQLLLNKYMKYDALTASAPVSSGGKKRASKKALIGGTGIDPVSANNKDIKASNDISQFGEMNSSREIKSLPSYEPFFDGMKNAGFFVLERRDRYDQPKRIINPVDDLESLYQIKYDENSYEFNVDEKGNKTPKKPLPNFLMTAIDNFNKPIAGSTMNLGGRKLRCAKQKKNGKC